MINNQNKREIITDIVSDNYSIILNSLSHLDKLNENFIKLMIESLLYSTNQYEYLIYTIFDNIPVIDSVYFSDLNISKHKTSYFITIYKRLLTLFNNKKEKGKLSYLFKLPLSKSLFHYKSNNTQDSKNVKISLVSLLFKWLYFDQNGKMFTHYLESDDAIINYKEKTNDVFYIDIDSILSNYIYYIDNKISYPNIISFSYDNYDSKWKSFILNEMPYVYIYETIEICVKSLFCLSNESFQRLLFLYCNCIQNKELVKKTNFHSIIRFLISCNYLFNFQTEEYYLNELELQKKNSYYTIDNNYQSKENLITLVIDLVTDNSFELKEYLNILNLLTFYINSTLDVELSNNKMIISNILDCAYKLLKFLFSSNEICIHFYLVIMIYFLKDILKYSTNSQIMDYIVICLLLSRQSESDNIYNSFSKLITIKYSNYSFPSNSFSETLSFFYHICDLTSLYYITYLYQRTQNKEDEQATEFLKMLFSYFKINLKNDRDFLFNSMLEIIQKGNLNRSNINEQEIIKNITHYRVVTGNRNKVFCIRNNNIIEITPISNIYSIISINIANTENKVIRKEDSKVNNITSFFKSFINNEDMQESDNEEYETNLISYNSNYYTDNILNNVENEDEFTKKKKEEQLCSLLSIPILITYHVNIFFYPKDYEQLTLNNLLNEIDLEDISPLFYKFVSKLGDLYQNDKGEKVLCYRDNYYNIIFELINLKKTNEEKLKLIQNNSVNIIWLDNPYIEINVNLFDSVRNNTNYSIVTIVPRTDNLYYVSIKPFNYFDDNEVINKDNRLDVNDVICDNYYINININSGIRYLINSIVLMNELLFYFEDKQINLYSMNNIQQHQAKMSSLYQRLQIIKRLNRINK